MDNLRFPVGRVPGPNPGAMRISTVPTPPLVFGAKSQMRLLTACDLMRYYDTVGRYYKTSSIRWHPFIKNFSELWGALVNRKKGSDPKVPKISKTLSVIKWTKAFADFLFYKSLFIIKPQYNSSSTSWTTHNWELGRNFATGSVLLRLT